MNKAKKFRLFISNGEYSAGCNGHTIYFYHGDKEICRIKDLIYVNFLVLSPDNDTLGVKTCLGQLAFYSLSRQTLIKKFRFAKDIYAQDGSCVFLPNGDFVNIEKIDSDLTSYLSFYSAKDLSLLGHYPEQPENVYYYSVEYDNESDACFVHGYDRHDDIEHDIFNHGYFVGKFVGNTLDKCYITEAESDFYWEYQHFPEVLSTKDLAQKHSLAKLYNYYKENKGGKK